MDCSAISPTHTHLHHRHKFPQKISATKSQIPNPNFNFNFNLNRRSLILLSTSLSLPTPLSFSDELTTTSPSPPPSSPNKPPPSPPVPDTTITDRIFMDFSACSTSSRNERTLGDEYTNCEETEILGRVVLGLYGKLVPITVSHFKAMCTGSAGSSYKGTIIQKIFPGKYFIAGKQGSKGKGEVKSPVNLSRNTETVDAKAFALKHSKAGVLSLCLSENDDEDEIKFGSDYRNVEFLITTGPAPCPELDGANIVFGTVLEGMDVVTNISTIPTYKPSERIRQFNDLAEFFGDERASNARSIWNRPLRTVYISDCGELKVAKPAMSPSLP
ncbi:peptidylprolyl isomerase [Ranunculus cassubicifolius]